MELPMTAIKYGLFVIIMAVFAVKIFQETRKIIKKFKKESDDNFDENLYG